MLDIQEIHEEVFVRLYDHLRDLDENMRFSLRKSNRSNRLQEGYWFYGNDDYVAVSFWKGMDWRNKTPNIFFGISRTGKTYLEISVTDSIYKNEFVISKILPEIADLNKVGNRYVKIYNNEGEFRYLDSLSDFIEPDGDRRKIDRIISKHHKELSKDESSPIGIIDTDEFETRLNFVLQFRNVREMSEIEKPIKLKSAIIKDFGPIRSIAINDIPFSNQWIFLTGMNGTGKSAILKSFGPALAQKELDDEEKQIEKPYDVSLALYDSFKEVHNYGRTRDSNTSPKLSALVKGFAAYGPVRLQTARRDIGDWQLKRALNKSKSLDSLREENESFLLDISTHIKHWRQKSKHKKHIKKRLEYIQEILREMFNGRFDVTFDKDDNISYVEIDDKGKRIGVVQYKHLSTGLRSTLSLIGDVLIRMYEQQPEVSDPSLFQGIVLIDEIDIHLHPYLQKNLVEEFSRTFSNLQFIVTTHSPIPLLGAPQEKTMIYVVRRSAEAGITIDRVDDKMYIEDLLPNSILSSPIFGMDNLVSSNRNTNKPIRTEDDFNDIVINNYLEQKIDEFLTDKKQNDLIKLFEDRRK